MYPVYDSMIIIIIITQRELPLVMRHLNSQSQKTVVWTKCVCVTVMKFPEFFIFLFCKDFYVTYVLM